MRKEHFFPMIKKIGGNVVVDFGNYKTSIENTINGEKSSFFLWNFQKIVIVLNQIFATWWNKALPWQANTIFLFPIPDFPRLGMEMMLFGQNRGQNRVKYLFWKTVLIFEFRVKIYPMVSIVADFLYFFNFWPLDHIHSGMVCRVKN